MSPLFLEILQNLKFIFIHLYGLGCPKGRFFACVSNQGKASRGGFRAFRTAGTLERAGASLSVGLEASEKRPTDFLATF